MGRGGSHKPINARVTSGVHDTGTAFPGIDFAAPRGTKVYAVGDGRITTSRDIPGPLSTDRYNGDGPYGSYGRYMILSLNKGGSVLYAHLDQRGFGVGKRVKGGTVIGRSGNTGNSSGPHLHFGASNGNPMAYLKKGGTVKYDNTPAILHKNERVLTAPLTNKLDTVVDAMYRAVKGGTTGGTNDGTFKPPKKKSKFKYPGLGMGAADYPYTWFDYGKNKKRRAPKNATLEPGKIKAGTYNSGTGSTSKLRADLKRLMPMVDVLSLQEMTTADARLKPWFDQMGWGWFNGGHQGTGLLWNKSSVSMSKGGSKELSPPGVSRGHRYAAYAKFQKKGGPAWWQIAAHTVAWPYKSKARRAEQTRQFLSLRALWQNLSKNGTPVIIGGDLNESIQRGDWIKKIGLGPGTNSGPGTHGKSWLDHLLFTGLVGGKSKVIKGLSSDHNALINSFSIPGFADGGKIRWDNTIANLHKDERVLAAPQTADLERGLRNFANGGNVTYNAHVYVTNADVDAEDVANIAIKKIQRIEARRPTSRRG